MTTDDAVSIAMKRSIPEPNTGCWLWVGAAVGGGYAAVRYEGRGRILTRVILGIDGLGIDGDPSRDACHRCDQPSCVNPRHLFAASTRANMHDMALKRRHSTAKAASPEELGDAPRCPTCGGPSRWRPNGNGKRTRGCDNCNYRRVRSYITGERKCSIG